MKTKILELMLCALAALPLGAWADDPTTVSEFREWFFNVQYDGTTASTNNGTVTSIQNYNGLYLRATSTSGHALTYKSITRTATFSDGRRITSSMGLSFPASNNFAPGNSAANADATDANDRCVALKTGVAGTLYIAYRPNSTTDRVIKLFLNGTAVVTHTIKSSLSSEGNVINQQVATMEYTANAGGTFFLGGNGGSEILYIRFVPSASSDPNANATFANSAIKASTTWTFDQYADIVSTTLLNSNTVLNYSGLYLHDVSTRTATVASTSTTALTMGNYSLAAGSPLSISYNGNHNGTAPSASDFAYSNNYGAAIAVDIAVPGNLYLALKGSNATERWYEVWFDGLKTTQSWASGDGNDKRVYPQSTSVAITKIPVTAAGSLYLSASSGSWTLVAAHFEPLAATTMSKDISISAAGYATFCAPQNYRWSTETYSNLKAYIVSEEPTTTSVTLTPIAASEGYITVPACTGVVLAGEAGDYTLSSVETATAVGTNLLKANLASYVLPYGDNTKGYNYTLAAGPTFKHPADADATALAAGKAFLKTTVNASKSGEAHSFSINFEDEGTTEIKNIEGVQPQNNIFYDMQGRMVAQPTKGLYIVNGKKVIIK